MYSLVVTCVFISSDVNSLVSLVVTCVFISSDVWIH